MQCWPDWFFKIAIPTAAPLTSHAETSNGNWSSPSCNCILLINIIITALLFFKNDGPLKIIITEEYII